MATIEFQCPGCGAMLETEFERGGDSSQCPQCHKTVLIPLAGIAPGIQIGGFVVESKLGAGGMGEVWLATQTAMDRKVAMKILAPALARDPDFIKRFIEEVKTSAKLDHSNIVSAHDAGCANGIYYLAMSFVDGYELSDRLHADGKLPEEEALSVAHGVAMALQYAWDRNRILHRDIKPANIMISSDGVVKLMDMGISKSLTKNNGLTMTGVIVGTPHYMSPEQARAEGQLDFRGDIYSLGATLYHAVTGHVPYDATTAMGILTKHITDPFPPPGDRNPELSEACAVLLEIMMAKKPEDRQQDWAAVLRDIDLVLAGKMPITPRPEVGASQVIRVDQRDPLAKRLERKRQKKARLAGASAESASDKPPAKSKTPLIVSPITVGKITVGILLVIAGVVLLQARTRKPVGSIPPPAVESIVFAHTPPVIATPTLSLPGSPRPEPPPVSSPEPQTLEPPPDPWREAWEKTSRNAEANPEDIEGAIAAYEDIMRRAADSRYGGMARDESRKLHEMLAASVVAATVELDPEPPEPPAVTAVLDLTPPPPPPIATEPARRESSAPEIVRAMTIYKSQVDAIKENTLKHREDLEQKYVAALLELESDLRDRGNLQHLLVVRTEIERFEKDPAADIDNIDALPEMMRTYWNTLITHRKQFDDEDTTRIAALTQRFLKHLNELKVTLTRQDRITDALEVEKEIAAVLLSPYLVPTLNIVVEAGRQKVEARIEQTKGPAAVLGKIGRYRLEAGAEYEFEVSYTETRPQRRWHTETLSVTADWHGVQSRQIVMQECLGPAQGRNWTSPSTGMEFIWIPVLKLWVGKFEVTNGEYRKMTPDHYSRSYANLSLNGDRQPVVFVNFYDAKAYAEWMTERDKMQLRGMRYRLPSEREWMAFAQCGDGREYPWGNEWPPPSGRAGNYSGQESAIGIMIDGYNDGFPVTAPVDQLWKNPWGLYGVGGNVWEACASDSSGNSFGAWRGASWNYSDQDFLRVSTRINFGGSYRNLNRYGFRLVMSR